MVAKCDWVLGNVHAATMTDNGETYGAVYQAEVAVHEGKIVYVGPAADNPFTAEQVIDGLGGWVTPGLIDCHTHLVYGGNRAAEFEQRLQGVSYEEIAKRGGGIQSTVSATRTASEADLLKSGTKRLKCLLAEGVTSVEIKSGYGLDRDTELKMLKVAKQLEQDLPVTIVTTYLGAHAISAEWRDNPDAYIDFICQDMIPHISQHQLAQAVDVFCEGIGFSPAQCEKVFQAAAENGLAIHAHAEQLSDLKGAVLAAKYGALSVEHLEYLQPDDVSALAQSGTVAVLLPGAFYSLNERQVPPIEALRAHQVPMAVATDLNPGSSPVASILTCMNMACVMWKMTPEEVVAGATRHAATALGLTHKGQLRVGADADLCLWPIQHPAELAYGVNLVKPSCVFVGGQHV